jgi:pimeloyl-ACP methyl ester carboxylesterase
VLSELNIEWHGYPFSLPYFYREGSGGPDIRAYHAYSFETVKESDAGQLIEEFVSLRMPKLFLYGEQNKALSYLPRLCHSDVHVVEIPSAAHFLFYDNPVATFQAIGAFVHTRNAGGNAGIEEP